MALLTGIALLSHMLTRSTGQLTLTLYIRSQTTYVGKDNDFVRRPFLSAYHILCIMENEKRSKKTRKRQANASCPSNTQDVAGEAAYPNELGRVSVSISNQCVLPQESICYSTQHEDPPMQRVKRTKRQEKAIDVIWKHLSAGHIDISYACVGYSLDGRPVLNYDDFTNLLVTYGFDIRDVVLFIDDFAEHSLSNDKSPIVMFTTNSSSIMTSIKPLS